MGTKRNRAAENTFVGETPGAFPQTQDAPRRYEEGISRRSVDTCNRNAGSEKEIRRTLRECGAQCTQLFSGTSKDESLDLDRIAPKVNSLRTLVEERFGDLWGPAWIHLAVGALACFRDRQCDVGLREHAQMLSVIGGGSRLRAHNGQVFTYTDGSWNVYDGLISEGAIARCRTFLLQLEGLFRAIAA